MAGLLSIFKKRPPAATCSAVIVAAGKASRMEGIDKMLAYLGELPVLVHTLYAFQDCSMVDEIVVVTREDLLVEVSRLCKEFNLDKVTKVVVGGAERIHSVQAGLREISPLAQLVAIHDGARPFASNELVEEAVSRAAVTGAAAPAIAITNTVKRVENGLAVETLDRTALRAVQTPQVFEVGLIRAALQKAVEDAVVLTDDCAAVERLGMKVALTQGSAENIKVTTPFDLLVGTAILEGRVRGAL